MKYYFSCDNQLKQYTHQSINQGTPANQLTKVYPPIN